MNDAPDSWHNLLRLFNFPRFDAAMNALSALLLVTGYLFIRHRFVRAHVFCMLAALFSSIIFLAGYVTYHALLQGRLTRFPAGPWRPYYLALLVSHTVLAVAVLPLVIITITYALRRKFQSHRRIARITFPIWLYVSITGVAVYWALYHLAPALRAAAG